MLVAPEGLGALLGFAATPLAAPLGPVGLPPELEPPELTPPDGVLGS
jgi:hypothetical protein